MVLPNTFNYSHEHLGKLNSNFAGREDCPSRSNFAQCKIGLNSMDYVKVETGLKFGLPH